MRVLAVNVGSSSLKAAVVESTTGVRLWEGSWPAVTGLPANPAELFAAAGLPADAFAARAVVHRIVHGGATFQAAVVIDTRVRQQLAGLASLAPLHNPPALAVVAALLDAFPEVPHVATFDTAFHARLPPHARDYALAPELIERVGIRRFGFHGLSHAHVLRVSAHFLKVPPATLRIISCHLGSGASVAAIANGTSVDTSMGMTPLEGLIMGTRAGDLDPGAVLALLRARGMDVDAVEQWLTRRSGLQGMTGSADLREVTTRAAQGDAVCQAALVAYAYRVRKYIGAYAAAMGGVDVLAFTGGVGENDAAMRGRCLERLEFLGVTLDESRNREARLSSAQRVAEIGSAGHRLRLLVVAADEELEMAREVERLLA